MIKVLSGRENLHTLDAYGFPLGVTCLKCDHRALLSLKRLNAHGGNMKRLIDVRLVCTQCKARDFEMTIFTEQADVDAWEWSQNAVVKPSF
jgi:predicted nucleic-acid-binding Zn-ribbon protein